MEDANADGLAGAVPLSPAVGVGFVAAAPTCHTNVPAKGISMDAISLIL